MPFDLHPSKSHWKGRSESKDALEAYELLFSIGMMLVKASVSTIIGGDVAHPERSVV
jgi:hypothetical protein